MLLDEAVEIGFKILRRREANEQDAEELPALEDAFPGINEASKNGTGP